MDKLLCNIIKTLPRIDMVDDNGNNLIHHFAGYGELELFKKIVNENKINMKTLLNQRNENGDTPLHIAVRNNNQEIADYLIKKGSNPSIVNFKGESCIKKMKK